MRFNASLRNTHRIWTNFYHSRTKTRIVKTLYLAFVKNSHFVIRTMKGGDLTHRLSNPINIERFTIIYNSKWRYCT